jgi:hypothetical protein
MDMEIMSINLLCIPRIESTREKKMRTSTLILITFLFSLQSFSQNAGYFTITTGSQVQFIVTDPLGRSTGEDPRGFTNPMQGKRISEIPNANYSTTGVGDSPSEDYQPSAEDIGFEFGYEIKSPEDDGRYAIQVIGITSSDFHMYVRVKPKRRSITRPFNMVVHGVTDSNKVITYEFIYHGMPGGEIRFQKDVTGFTLLEDVQAMRKINWIMMQPVADKYAMYFSTYNTQVQQNNFGEARITLNTVIQNLNSDSASAMTIDAYESLRSDTYQLLNQLPPSGCNVKLINSTGTKLTGGSLQYYEGSWKDAINNNDGTFFVNTTAKTLSLRMTYEYGSQTKSNVTVGPDTVVFQTVNTQVKLENSQGIAIDTGSVQYYAGAWRNFGSTINGVASKELLPANCSFRMTYAYASKDKQQDIGTNAMVVFQTVNATVQLQNSQGVLIDQGTVQYYSGAWRQFGTTANGVVNKELLPNNYSFRMTYAYASKDKQQDIGTNPMVVFRTVNAAVQLQNSQGSLIDQGVVQYYSGAWQEFGTTSNGVANKELLPNNYSFRMIYAYASKDKQQDIGANPTVVFQTVNAAVQLKNSLGNLIDQGTVQYYSGAWRTFGTTTNGTVSKELLANTYSFRMTYGYVSLDKSQDLAANSTVDFSTVLCTIRVKNAEGQPIDGATASYYSGAWRQIGATLNGEITKELLPVNLTFRIKDGTQQQDKRQNLSTNNVVEFAAQ